MVLLSLALLVSIPLFLPILLSCKSAWSYLSKALDIFKITDTSAHYSDRSYTVLTLFSFSCASKAVRRGYSFWRSDTLMQFFICECRSLSLWGSWDRSELNIRVWMLLILLIMTWRSILRAIKRTAASVFACMSLSWAITLLIGKFCSAWY